jgi:hypothetical protein
MRNKYRTARRSFGDNSSLIIRQSSLGKVDDICVAFANANQSCHIVSLRWEGENRDLAILLKNRRLSCGHVLRMQRRQKVSPTDRLPPENRFLDVSKSKICSHKTRSSSLTNIFPMFKEICIEWQYSNPPLRWKHFVCILDQLIWLEISSCLQVPDTTKWALYWWGSSEESHRSCDTPNLNTIKELFYGS